MTSARGTSTATPLSPARERRCSAAYFVTVWGSGFVVTRIALEYAAPFTYIGVRYAIAFAVALLAFGLRAAWPRTPALWGHVAIAGLLSHAGYLGGSHYAQRWGLSAGVTALILALQPMLTALIMSRWLHERLSALQMLGVAVGLGGVALVVGHRVDGAAIALREPARRRLGAGLRHRRARSTSASSAPRSTCAPRSASTSRSRRSSCCRWARRSRASPSTGTGRSPRRSLYHVVLASIGAYTILHLLLRRGQATSVTSLLYLTPPVAALVEWAVYGVPPTATMWLGMAVACIGVAMVSTSRAAQSKTPIVEEPS